MSTSNKIHYAWIIAVGGTFLSTVLVPPVIALFGKFILPVTADMGISRSSFTFSTTIIQGLGIFISPFVAKKLASGNFRRILSISVTGFALAYASFGFAQSLYWFYVSSFFIGLFFSFSTIIPLSMLITNWFNKKRGLAMSVVMAGIGVGGFLFSPIITLLLEAFGWRATYIIMGGIMFAVSFPVSAFIVRKSPEDMGLKPYGAEEGDSEGGTAEEVGVVTISVKECQRTFFFWLLIGGMALTGFVNSGALGQFPPALQEAYGGATQAAIISLYSIIGVGGKLVLGWINDRWGVIASSVFGCTCFCLAFLCMILGASVFSAYLMALFLGLGMAIGPVSPPLITACVFGQKKYGEAYGIAASALQAGLTIGSFAVAGIYDFAGSYQPAWILLFFLTIATLVCWVGGYLLSRRYC